MNSVHSKRTGRRLARLIARTRRPRGRQRTPKANGGHQRWIQGSDHSLRIPMLPPKAY